MFSGFDKVARAVHRHRGCLPGTRLNRPRALDFAASMLLQRFLTGSPDTCELQRGYFYFRQSTNENNKKCRDFKSRQKRTASTKGKN